MKQSAPVKTVEALEARVHLGSLMDEVEKTNARFLVSKRGKPKIIMLSVNDYLENILQEDNFLTRIHLKARESGLAGISEEEIDTEVKAARAGRKKKTR
jgi:prevent-host-death family protein